MHTKDCGSKHRSTREAAKGRELADLKRKNRQLTRENARLLKLVSKATATKEAFEDEDPPQRSGADVEVVSNKCTTPGCRGTFRRVDLNRIVLDVCAVCLKRIRVS